MDTRRNQRVRRLVRKLNRARKIQAKKIDLLCDDMIKAHRNSLRQLRNFGLVLEYYEKILGLNNIDALLDTTAQFIHSYLDGSNVAIYIHGTVRTHIVDPKSPENFDHEQFEQCFAGDIVDGIFSLNNCRNLDQLLEAGLQVNPALAKKVSATAIPFNPSCPHKGLILLYRCAQTPLGSEQIKNVCALVPTLCRLIGSIKEALPTKG